MGDAEMTDPLSMLPKYYQYIYSLVEERGLTCQEAAIVLGIPEDKVARELQKAKDMLASAACPN